MAECVLESEERREWLPWFRAVFEHGQDVPPDRAARLIVWLASGNADVLSGRFFTVFDDVLDLVERAKRGGGSDRQTLRLQS
jgi:hypothetical protein